MSAFEDFIQLEIPKRPYLDVDGATETVMVRRGAGPRQLQAVDIAEGQVLAKVGGVIISASLSSLLSTYGGGVRKAILPVTTASQTWTITHNLNSENVIVQIFDSTKSVIIPDSIQITSANVVTATFSTAVTGTARVIFLD